MMSAGTRLFVGNVPKNTTDSDLENIFSEYGTVVNVDLKFKDSVDGESKGFAFVTVNGGNHDIESCINTVARQDYNGVRLYVTRARESFMERLKRERAEAEVTKKTETVPEAPKDIPMKKPFTPLVENKRKSIQENDSHQEKPGRKRLRMFEGLSNSASLEPEIKHIVPEISVKKERREKIGKIQESFTSKVPEQNGEINNTLTDEKKLDSNKKRLESIRKMKKAYTEKKNLIKIGLSSVDKVPNKKIVFSDSDSESQEKNKPIVDGNSDNYEKIYRKPAKALFDNEDDEASGEEPTFEVKEQFEGQKGQKLLELQNRYKADKRFALDQRFMEGDGDEEIEEQTEKDAAEDEGVRLSAADEKEKQYKILQDVLGVTIRNPHTMKPPPGAIDKKKQSTTKLGMLRFDPSRAEHTKFLTTTDTTNKSAEKKSKKERKKEREDRSQLEKEEYKAAACVVPAVQVSEEKFYKVSETLKDSLAQSNGFSLRSLFSSGGNADEEPQTKNYIDKTANDESIIIEDKKKDKVRNPFDKPGKNPFKYDSSDSEPEDEETQTPTLGAEGGEVTTEPRKPAWEETFFFVNSDARFKEGLEFFSKTEDTNFVDRRELKFVMKKRLQNSSRKDQMFSKKIGGGRKKSHSSNKGPPYQRKKY